MALSQKHRSSLFVTLTPLVGEEEAEALLAEFPSNDLETPATKEFVRAELAGVEARLSGRLSESELRLGDRLAGLERRFSDQLRTQMVWLTGLVIAAIGIVRALAG